MVYWVDFVTQDQTKAIECLILAVLVLFIKIGRVIVLTLETRPVIVSLRVLYKQIFLMTSKMRTTSSEIRLFVTTSVLTELTLFSLKRCMHLNFCLRFLFIYKRNRIDSNVFFNRHCFSLLTELVGWSSDCHLSLYLSVFIVFGTIQILYRLAFSAKIKHKLFAMFDDWNV